MPSGLQYFPLVTTQPDSVRKENEIREIKIVMESGFVKKKILLQKYKKLVIIMNLMYARVV